MKNLVKKIFATAAFTAAAFVVSAQCTVQVSPAAVTIDCGETVDLSALGLSSTPALSTDFNNNAIGAGWQTSATLVYTNPCGPSLDGSPSAWFGNVPLPRTLTTNGFDMSCGGQVCFDLDFGGDENTTDCEDPDEIDEGVFFQYSVDGGTTWIDIFYFEPTTNITGPYYSWANYCFTIPPGAWSASTMFQWDQPNATSSLNDHWGIDNVVITPSDCNYWYDWDNLPPTNDPTDQTVSPTTTTTYNVDYTDGTDICSASVTVTVNPYVVNASATNTLLNCGDCTDLNVTLANPPTNVCNESATANGFDNAGTTAAINGFPCVPGGATITSVQMDASIGGFCPAWYDYDLYIDGVPVQFGLCDIVGMDLTPWLPFNSVSIVSNDNDIFADLVNMSLFLNITYTTNPVFTYSWTPATGLNNPNIQNPQACPTTNTTYTGTITETNSGCTGSDNVNIIVNCLCTITNMNANIGACNAGAYQTTGQVEFTDPPATGQLIVEDCNGNQQVFNAPFVSPIAYTITGQTPDGAACDITAYFTDDVACTQTIPYVAPTCPCNIDNFNATIGLCDQLTNTYCMTGDVFFTNPPAGGTLIVEVNNGTNTYDTIINPPYVSGQTWSVCGIPADGAASTVTVYFSTDPGCTSVINYTAPTDCSCNADLGTFTTNITGSSTNNYVLCFGDGIDITSNGDWTGPGEQFNPPGPPYNPGVSWLIYSCPPTVALVPDPGNTVPSDPCFLGLVSATDLNDLNNGGSWMDAFPPGTFTNNTVYFVPITMYDQVGGTYSYVNGTMPCYELGAPYPVQYVPQFTTTNTEDCLAGTADVTVNGGMPAIDGSNFVASNLMPANASFVNTTATDGGIIQISGLQGGDMWSFDLTDDNGCPYTVTGGPFPPLEDPGFNYPATSWCTSEPPAVANITGVPGGTFTVTPAGLSINAATGQITPGASTPGTYDITYTTPGACFDDSTITVNIAQTPSVDPIPNQTICDGAVFADIIFTGSAGTTFDWTNDNTNIGLAANGTGDILSFTGTAPTVQEVANIVVTPTAGACTGPTETFTLTVDPIEDPSFNYAQTSWCTSEGPMAPTITGTGGGNFTSVPAGLSINATTGQITPGTSTPGTYDVTYTTTGACPNDSTITVNIAATPTVDPVADQTICDGDNFADILFTGSAGTVFDWVNDNTGIGLAANGTGDILAFAGTAPTVQEVANITVTPTAGSCVGTPTAFVLTVDPLDDASFNYAQTSWCTAEPPMTPTITGTAGGNFTSVPAGLSLNAATGEITPGTSTPGTYDVTYTTTGACPANTTITVNVAATPSVDPIPDQTICDATQFADIIFTGSAGTVFNWTNDNTNIGLGANGVGDIMAFTGTAPTVQEVANIVVTPTAGTCVGTTESFVLTVNPQDDASFTYPASAWCTSDAVQAANITGTAGGNFTSVPAGLTLNAATGDITPGTSAPGTYDVTYTTAGVCPDNQTVTVTINPVPDVNAVPNETVCVGDNFTAITFTGTVAGTTFDWTNDNANIGLAAAGTGDIASFVGATTGGVEVGNITVTPSTTSCTGTPINFTLTVNPLDDASFDYPGGLTYCLTGTDPTANITGLAGGTFTYVATSGGPTLDIDPATGNITLISSDLGVYDITYNTTGAVGSLCPQTTTLTLTITDAPVADFTLDIYCANDADPLPTFINGGSGGNFTSAPGGLTINPATGEVDLDVSTPGTYTMTNTINVPGCALATYDDDITIFELPDANIVGSTTICPSDPLPDVDINITAGAANWDITYDYNGTPTTVNAAASPFTIGGANFGTYDLVSITDGNGCTNTITGQVVIDSFPTPSIDPVMNQYVCEGSDLTLTSFTGNPAGTTFDWTNTSGVDLGFGLNGTGDIGTFTGVNGTGLPAQANIEVTPTSPNGCVGPPTNFLVTVNPLPVVSFTGGPLAGCEPLLVNFTNTTSPTGANCVWDFGNGTTGMGCGDVATTYNTAGTYDVSLTVTTAEGCTASTTYANYVNVSPQPHAAFSYSPQEITVEDTEVDFTNQSVDADNYLWDFGDNSATSTAENLAHMFPSDEPGEYLVTLWAYNSTGTCYDSTQQLIIVQDVIIFYVPNVMTPDGDQFNEIFQPVFTSGFDPFDFHLTIFNRWGEIIFESYDASKGWNGHYGDGGLVQDGVYVWQIDFKESMSDRRHTHRGHVTVLK